MSILSRIGARSPIVPQTAGYGWINLITASTDTVSPDNAMQHTTVYACVQAIADAIASVSLSIYTRKEKGKVKAGGHPLYRLLKYAPNPYISSFDWRQMVIIDVLLRGNHYSQIVRDGLGNIVGLYPLVSQSVIPRMRKSGKLVFEYASNGGNYVLRQDEVLHIKGLPDQSGIIGLSPIEYNRKAIQLSLTTEQFGINFFENGANGSGVLEHPQTLSDEAYERLRKSFAEKYQGIKNSGKPIILEEGLKYTRLSMSNEDSQFLSTRKYQRAEIASIFKVPLYMIGDMEKSTFNNMEQMGINFVTNTLMAWAVRIEQSIKNQLLGIDTPYFARFNLNTLMRGDFKTRMEGYNIMLNMGAISPNEIREKEGFNPIGPSGDEYYMQLNMATLDTIKQGGKNAQ